MSGYPWPIKQSVLIFSERANTNARIAATKATSPIQSVRTAARKRHRIKATTVMTQARLTRRRITTRCSATMMTESRICFKKDRAAYICSILFSFIECCFLSPTNCLLTVRDYMTHWRDLLTAKPRYLCRWYL